MVEQRTRGISGSGAQAFAQAEITVEDLTVMKLMEEIMELDQEIKMKQKFINSRMKMLHKLIPEQKTQTKISVETFMKSLQPNFPNELTVDYARPGSDAIPMQMYSEPIPLKQGDVYKEPIAMQDQQMASAQE